jgi:hypothetical protein
MNGYELSRNWFDWAFENPELVNPNHTAIYFYVIDQCNRLGWKDKFGLPSQMAMDALGIKKHETFFRYFNDLVDWGFIGIVQKSKNQYTANIITLKSAIPKKGTALEKAILGHTEKQTEGMGVGISSIDKPITLNLKPKTIQVFDFSDFGIFIPLVEKWIEYKKSRNENYKSQVSLNVFVKILTKYSENKFEIAENIIEQSMANNWAGIFKPKPEFKKFENEETTLKKLSFKDGKANN